MVSIMKRNKAEKGDNKSRVCGRELLTKKMALEQRLE